MYNLSYFQLLVALTLVLAAIALYFIVAFLDKPDITCPILREQRRKKRQIGYILLVVAAVIFGLTLAFRKKLSLVKRQKGRQWGAEGPTSTELAQQQAQALSRQALLQNIPGEREGIDYVIENGVKYYLGGE